MADKVRLEAVISASSQGMVDALKRASAAVNDSTAGWKQRFSRARGDLATVSEAVRNLTSAVGQMGQVDIGADQQSVSRLRDTLTGLQGVFDSTRGDVESLSSALVAMRQEASSLGMPVEEYQRFADAVQTVGMDVSQAGQMMQSMRQRIQDFANGVPEAVDMFGRLGITLEQLGSNTPMANFAAIAQAIQGVVPATEQATASAQMYSRAMQDVLRVSQAYTDILANKGGTQYASDKDVQQAIGLADALGRVGQSIEAVANRLNEANAAGGAAVQTGMRGEQVFRSMMEALDAYNRQLSESATAVYSVANAYQILMQDIGRLSVAARNHSIGKIDDEEFRRSLDGMSQNLSGFARRIEEEFAGVRAAAERNISIGAPVDISAIDRAVEHLNILAGAMVTFDRVSSSSGYGREGLDGLGEAIQRVRNDLSELRSDSIMSNLMPDISALGSRIDEMAKSLDAMMRTPVRMRTEVDTKGIDELRARLDELRSRARQVLGAIGDTGVVRSDAYRDALKPLEDGLLHIDGLMRVINSEQERFSAEARNGVTVWTMMGRGVSAVGSAIAHPVDSARRLADYVRQAWQWMTRFKSASADAGNAVDATGKQLGHVFGMLTGMGSKVMIIVKGFRAMADAAKEVAKWFTEASKRQAEMQSGMAGDAGEHLRRQRQETDARVDAVRKYAEAVDKWRGSGKSEDRAAAESARRELWEKYGVRANEENASKVLREQSEAAYDERVDQNESETRLYRELVPQLRKAMEERKGYLSDVFGKGADLSAKLGEDTVLTDLAKQLGDAQRRLGELEQERRQIDRTERGGEYRDYIKVRGGRADDAMRERIRSEQERRDKRFADRDKEAEKAAGELSDWSAQVTMEDVDRQIRDVWKKYNDIVKAGGDRQKAYQVAVEAVRKIREEAERKEADELRKLADEHERQAKSLQDATEREQDARRRMLESYRALYEAQERQAYEMRLDRLGKARERLRRRMEQFGFTLPGGFRSGSPNLSVGERRNIRLDDRIADKLARRQAGERVHFSRRELERIRELEKLMKRDKAMSAEEKAIRAAQTQDQAAKTMKSASEAFWKAVKAFYEASTGRKLETEKEKEAREKKERRERARKRNEERRKPPEQKGDGGRPSGGDGSGRAPKPAPRPGNTPRPAGEPLPSVFLDFDQYLRQFGGDKSKAADYYKKYVEVFNAKHNTKHEAVTHDVPAEYPPSVIERKLPPEYDNATREQRARALWNRRAHPEDYDDEGNWKYSPNGWRGKARNLEDLYAPGRTGVSMEAHDYSGVLERIAEAVEADRKSYTVK